MASDSTFDPYRPPAAMDVPYDAPGAPPRRPGWLVTICVISIALGGMGFLHALYGFVELTVGEQMQAAMRPGPGAGGPEELEELQKEFEDGIREVQQRYFIPLLLFGLARLALTACLVVGGIMCLGLKPPGRKLLIGAFIAALLFEVGDSILQGKIAGEMIEPMRALGAAIDEQQPRQGNVPLELGRTIIVGLFWVIMGVFYVLQVAKFVFYLTGLLYLRRTSLDPLFVPRAEAVS